MWVLKRVWRSIERNVKPCNYCVLSKICSSLGKCLSASSSNQSNLSLLFFIIIIIIIKSLFIFGIHFAVWLGFPPLPHSFYFSGNSFIFCKGCPHLKHPNGSYTPCLLRERDTHTQFFQIWFGENKKKTQSIGLLTRKTKPLWQFRVFLQ